MGKWLFPIDGGAGKGMGQAPPELEISSERRIHHAQIVQQPPGQREQRAASVPPHQRRGDGLPRTELPPPDSPPSGSQRWDCLDVRGGRGAGRWRGCAHGEGSGDPAAPPRELCRVAAGRNACRKSWLTGLVGTGCGAGLCQAQFQTEVGKKHAFPPKAAHRQPRLCGWATASRGANAP